VRRWRNSWRLSEWAGQGIPVTHWQLIRRGREGEWLQRRGRRDLERERRNANVCSLKRRAFFQRGKALLVRGRRKSAERGNEKRVFIRRKRRGGDENLLMPGKRGYN